MRCSDGSRLPPAPAVPRPRRRTVDVAWAGSLLLIVRFAVWMPSADAVYAICTVVDAPGASVLGSVMPLDLNCPALVPLTASEPDVSVRLASPVFLIVSDWFGLDPVPPLNALAMSLK